MIIVALTDIHGDLGELETVAPALSSADVVLVAGDLTHFGRDEDAMRVLDALRPHAPRLLAVPGNCDRPEAARVLQSEGVDLHGQGRVIGGLGFVGAGGSLPCPGKTPFELSESELETVLGHAFADLPPGIPFVLLSHSPPQGTRNDRIHSGAHVGSSAVRRFIEARRPLVCFTGHIHEGDGLDEIGPTRIVNPGPLKSGAFARAEIGGRLEHLEILGGRP